jgi:rhodanese-related sulfurtransferase
MTFRRGVVLALALAPALAAARIEAIGADAVRAWVAGPRRATVVDVRSPQEYEQGHIAGAISIPAERVKVEAGRLPRDAAAPLIFYCRGPG